MAKNNNAAIFDFLNRLKKNNNREWFNANKQEYLQLRAMWLEELDSLIQLMAQVDPTLRGLTAKNSAYQIYRDIRFSHDKTPYKTHFSALIAPGGKKDTRSAYYLQVSPGNNSGLYGGIWCPSPADLKSIRHAIDDNIEEFEGIITTPRFKENYNLYGESLKMMPKGFDKNNPNGKYVKMKEFLLEKKCNDSYFTQKDWIQRVASDFLLMKPFHDFMNFSMDEMK